MARGGVGELHGEGPRARAQCHPGHERRPAAPQAVANVGCRHLDVGALEVEDAGRLPVGLARGDPSEWHCQLGLRWFEPNAYHHHPKQPWPARMRSELGLMLGGGVRPPAAGCAEYVPKVITTSGEPGRCLPLAGSLRRCAAWPRLAGRRCFWRRPAAGRGRRARPGRRPAAVRRQLACRRHPDGRSVAPAA